jgi:hypothetical protein
LPIKEGNNSYKKITFLLASRQKYTNGLVHIAAAALHQV